MSATVHGERSGSCSTRRATSSSGSSAQPTGALLHARPALLFLVIFVSVFTATTPCDDRRRPTRIRAGHLRAGRDRGLIVNLVISSPRKRRRHPEAPARDAGPGVGPDRRARAGRNLRLAVMTTVHLVVGRFAYGVHLPTATIPRSRSRRSSARRPSVRARLRALAAIDYTDAAQPRCRRSRCRSTSSPASSSRTSTSRAWLRHGAKLFPVAAPRRRAPPRVRPGRPRGGHRLERSRRPRRLGRRRRRRRAAGSAGRPPHAKLELEPQ